MESTNFAPYCPTTQQYEPGQISDLILKEDEALYRHSHLNFDGLIDLTLRFPPPSLIDKVVSAYANIKYDIDNLKKLLEVHKTRPALYFDLTKILCEDQFSESVLLSLLDSLPIGIIRRIQKYPLQLLEGQRQNDGFSTQDSIKENEKGKEKESSSTGLSGPLTKICKFYEENNEGTISFNCDHSHSSPFLFKTYKELCHLISSIKADLAYFNNIENSQEWAFYSTQSEEIQKLFKFKVEIEKNKDEIYLRALEKVEPAAIQFVINTLLQMNKIPTFQAAPHQAAPQPMASSIPRPMNSPFTGLPTQPQFNQQRPRNILRMTPTEIIIDDLKMKKNRHEILISMINILRNVTSRKYNPNLQDIDPYTNSAFDKLSTLLELMINNKAAEPTLLHALRNFLHSFTLNGTNSSLPASPNFIEEREKSSLKPSNQTEKRKRKPRQKPTGTERKRRKTTTNGNSGKKNESSDGVSFPITPVLRFTINAEDQIIMEKESSSFPQVSDDLRGEDWIEDIIKETDHLKRSEFDILG